MCAHKGHPYTPRNRPTRPCAWAGTAASLITSPAPRMDADETPSASESGVRSSGRGFHAGGNSAVGAAGGGAAAGCGGGGGEMVSSFAVDLRLSYARGGGICMLHRRSTIRGVWPSACEG